MGCALTGASHRTGARFWNSEVWQRWPGGASGGSAMAPPEADGIEAEWSRICRRLEASGLKALRHRGVVTGREKAEALRLVVRGFRSAAEKYVEGAAPAFPVVVRTDETSSGPLAAPNIDNWYLYVPLNAAYTYCVTGNLSNSATGSGPTGTPISVATPIFA